MTHETDDRLPKYKFPMGLMNLAQFIIHVEAINADVNIPLLRKAYEFSSWAHRGQKRKSGEPYVEHSLNVAFILAEQRLDSATVAAGLLHDVVEDAGITIEVIEKEFSAEIAQLVNGVSKLSAYRYNSREEIQADYFRKMLLSMADDIRIIIIKLADRLHNMRTLEYLDRKRQVQIATETREIFAPLAHRFGMAKIKWELEDLSLKYLNPNVYDELVKRIDESRSDRQAYINEVTSALSKMLREEGLQAEISGRAKHFDSIYRKMAKRKLPFDQIFDLVAVRIITGTIKDCYHTMGVIHNQWTPVNDRFHDYIAVPKQNMYQSLHTTVVGPRGRMVEIQIRTRAMHHVAEYGIAAHWLYKEDKKELDEADRQLAWLHEVLTWQKEMTSPAEFLEYLKIDLFQDEVFVFTPKGELKRLRHGATALDFAFSVHTDVGLHCSGTKVNGRLVPFETLLKSGDEVEVLTSPHAEPSWDWLATCKTSVACAKIRKYLKQKGFEESVRLGKEMLERTLKKKRLKQPSQEQIIDAAMALSFTGADQMFSMVGHGEIDADKLVAKIYPPDTPDHPKESLVKKFVDRARHGQGIKVAGIDNMMFRFARCCQPVPGEKIVGFITRGRGISIHRADCINAIKHAQEPERQVEVSWDVRAGQGFLVKLRVIIEERKNIMADIIEVIASADADIRGAEISSGEAAALGQFIIQIKNINHLNRVMDRIKRKVKGVIEIERSFGSDQEPAAEDS
ncbi:MAG: bifunctional (p)ppGpp synthetase/guanosine-3',5'-bis(diphosphate) 3'-pyrophosphohydrolase [candidate division Zixibacteria bacterium]|nr:bifunctional (p)ppGpp synthetase/guanosine-3',5'-bis(diphosphate) 3'-pyrophosphohydrolase [candidate division Zixibacteria bacterium]